MKILHYPREDKLQRLLRKLRKKGSIDIEIYKDIFPKDSQTSRFYGLPKLHKKRKVGQPPPLRIDLIWQGNLESLKVFVLNDLQMSGRWSSARGYTLHFTNAAYSVK